jgi:hypothetical protein
VKEVNKGCRERADNIQRRLADAMKQDEAMKAAASAGR